MPTPIRFLPTPSPASNPTPRRALAAAIVAGSFPDLVSWAMRRLAHPRRAIEGRLIVVKGLHSCSILLASEARRGARAIANYRRTICRFVVLLAIVGVGGCYRLTPGADVSDRLFRHRRASQMMEAWSAQLCDVIIRVARG